MLKLFLIILHEALDNRLLCKLRCKSTHRSPRIKNMTNVDKLMAATSGNPTNRQVQSAAQQDVLNDGYDSEWLGLVSEAWISRMVHLNKLDDTIYAHHQNALEEMHCMMNEL